MPLLKKQELILKKLQTRHGRKKENLCLCEGFRSVSELCERTPENVEFIVASKEAKCQVKEEWQAIILDEKEFNSFSDTVNSQGVIAVAKMPELLNENNPYNGDFILALDRINDPGNFGTICRTAYATNLTEIWYTKGTVDPFGNKAIRASMGIVFSLKFRQFENLETLKITAEKLGYMDVYITDPHGNRNCFTDEELFNKTVLVIGGEANGASEISGARKVTIPMPGKFESLNAAQAATVFLFEYVRRTI